jgi:uncharacterized integral membrane protein (TIGR00698 family)
MLRDRKDLARHLQTLSTGLAFAVVVAACARLAAIRLPGGLSEILLAVWLGLLVASVAKLPVGTEPGLRFAQQRILRLGIILLGARLSLGDVAGIGFNALGLVVVCIAGAFTFVWLVGKLAHMPPRLVLLIGVGTAVCGNSAIIATAPVVKADEREVSFAVATITIFGTLAVFLYPLLGSLLHMSNVAFGVWAGTAVNDTSQVVAAAAAFSPESRDVATVVKLVRNTLMAPLIVLVAFWWNRSDHASEVSDRAKSGALKAFPLFVLGFLVMALLRSLGVIDVTSAQILDEIAKVCILVALAAVGLGTRLGLIRAVGPAPFLLGLAAGTLLATTSLAGITLLHLEPSLHGLP